MRNKRLHINEVAEHIGEKDFGLYFGQFLDDYHHAENKAELIEEEPDKELESSEQLCLLAATADRLAWECSIGAPPWVHKKKYYLSKPCFAQATRSLEYQELLRNESLPEFSERNLFYGGNILDRL